MENVEEEVLSSHPPIQLHLGLLNLPPEVHALSFFYDFLPRLLLLPAAERYDLTC